MGIGDIAFTRRRLLRNAALGLGAAALTSPMLSACGDSKGGNGGVSSNGLKSVQPDYVPLSGGAKPDIPSVPGASGAASDPGFLSYPTDLVKTVAQTPGAGGTYKAITPLWGSIPPANNAYYQAVNKALGATIEMSPANGATYDQTIPTLVAGNKLPDWIQLPGWWNAAFNVGGLAANRFADLTPYLSGSNIRKYPNLAAIPTGGWQAGAWDGKLYGIPSFTTGESFAGTMFYRKDVFAERGINPDDIKTADDLYHLGGQLTAKKSNVWAFDVLWLGIQQMFNVPFNPGFYLDGDKLISAFEAPQFIPALEFAYKLAKAGYVHPDALADDTSNAKQRFYSGKLLATADGLGAWNTGDAQQGRAANAKYARGAFKLFSADGSTPTIPLGYPTRELSYLNKKLSKEQIEECLRIADYLAAPFGSAEYTLVRFGVEGADWTRGATGPTYTTAGQKAASQDTYTFLCTPQAVVSNPGFEDVTRDHCAWSADAVKHAVKPVFWNMNITVPTRFSTALSAQPVTDTIKQVTYGRKTVQDFQNAVKAWKAAGGDQMVAWHKTEVLDKYGNGQQ